MRFRRLPIVVVVLLLVPTVARAHDHTADFFSAFCYAYDSNLFGVQQALSVTSPKPGNKDLSIVFDTSVHMGKHEGDSRTRVLIMGGVRYTLTQLLDPDRHLVTAHFLAGGMRDGGAVTTADPAVAFGGGYEYLKNGTATGLGFRFQFDYVVSGGQDFPRFSGGIVYRK